MMGSVPNQPKTTAKNFRIEDDVWKDAQIIANKLGTKISVELRDFVYKYVDQHRELL
jgi:hypothetical protein